VTRWAESGLTARQYAARIGVNHQTLSHWKYKLAREERDEQAGGDAGRAPEFVEVTTMLVVDVPLEIVAASGDVVRVPVGFDEETLARVLDVLAARQ
jgi:hypothetical protein